MKLKTWDMIELFGTTHVRIPQSTMAVCEATLNPNIEVTVIDNIRQSITCDRCLTTLQSLQIPTSV